MVQLGYISRVTINLLHDNREGFKPGSRQGDGLSLIAMNNRSPRNYPLWIGLILLSLFLLVAVFGPRLAPHDPVAVITDVFRIGDRAYIPSVQPVPPLTVDQFLLGTDIGGRDLFRRLLWAVRPTLILCFIIAALRITLGVVLGLAAGWVGGAVGRAIEILIDVSLAVPILLFALAVISFIGCLLYTSPSPRD